VKRRVTSAIRRRRDRFGATYRVTPYAAPRRLLKSSLDFAALEVVSENVVEAYLEHRFDLLGSGWTHVGPVEPRVNAQNAAYAASVAKLIDKTYVPIDWQLDFKSGYRWDATTWSADIRYGHVAGVDVKVPWELARMQHLPQLALVYAQRGGEMLVREFRNVALDFIATNPPRFGVNWACTMDVAIRAANLVLAFDLFLAAGATFDDDFLRVFQSSMWDHAWHIVENPERYGPIRANHYLANVAGLIWVASWLPENDTTRKWLDWAEAELIGEVAHQFHADGSNFEASTAYHRLSGEMVVFAAALLRKPLPEIERMADFALAATKPDGTMHQAGDNDNGRFFKLDAEERHLDVRTLAAAARGLIDREDWPVENATHVVRALSPLCGGGRPRPPVSHLPAAEGGRGYTEATRYEGTRLREGLEWRAFPDFGLYVLRSPRLYAGIVARGRGWRGMTGHRHNDQLALELWVDGKNIYRDPGAYLYTSDPAARDRYRSVHAHATPWPFDDEPASLTPGLFAAGPEPHVDVLRFGADGFEGEMVARGSRIRRRVTIEDDEVRVLDTVDGVVRPPKDGNVPFSCGYGALESPR
jgi:Heparinase II/III N-terminus/Heparinase II/III-like protein